MISLVLFLKNAYIPNSLASVQWTTQIYTHFTSVKDLPVLVLGLKRDLRSETDPNGIIYPQEAYRVAQEMRCDKYIECSALTGELMTEAFEDICRTAALATTTNGGMTEGGCAVM
jgi:Ras family protein A